MRSQSVRRSSSHSSVARLWEVVAQMQSRPKSEQSTNLGRECQCEMKWNERAPHCSPYLPIYLSLGIVWRKDKELRDCVITEMNNQEMHVVVRSIRGFSSAANVMGSSYVRRTGSIVPHTPPQWHSNNRHASCCHWGQAWKAIVYFPETKSRHTKIWLLFSCSIVFHHPTTFSKTSKELLVFGKTK